MPLSTKIISPEETPELFFLPRSVDLDTPLEGVNPKAVERAYDELGELLSVKVYDQKHKDISGDFAEGKSFKRKAKDGMDQDLHVYDDMLKLYHNDILKAESKVYGDIFVDGEWLNYNFGKSDVSIIEDEPKKLKALKIADTNEFEIIAPWESDNFKATFRVTLPGQTLLIRWYIRAYDLEDLIVDHSDYKGNTSDTDWVWNEAGYWERTITFEPDGVQDELIVDPYLSSDEQVTYIIVENGDGFSIKINEYTNDFYWHTNIYSDDTQTDQAALLATLINPGGVLYSIQYDQSATLTLLEDSPTRVRILLSGLFCNSSHSALIHSTSLKLYFTVFSDRFTVDYEWITSGTINIGDYDRNALSWFFPGGTSPNGVCESIGSEISSADNTEYNTANYCGFTTDELDAICINLACTDSDDYRQKHTTDEGGDGSWSMGWNNNASFPAGTHTASFMYIFDSDGRSGGKQYGGSGDDTYRLAMGVQYKNTTPATLDPDTPIDDLNIPKTITATDGLASDGARYLETTSRAEKITFGQTEIEPVIVLDDSEYWISGSTPDDLLVGHWKCDDTDADTVIDDETGNYDGTLGGGNTLDNLTSIDAVRGKSILLDGTNDYLDLSSSVAGLSGSKTKLTIVMDFKPNFAVTVSSNQYLFALGSGTADRILFYYDIAPDSYVFQNDIQDAGDITIIGTDYTGLAASVFLQWKTLMVSLDLDNDIVIVSLDGKVIFADIISEVWESTPDFFVIGAERESPTIYGSYYIDNVKLIDGCILPFGTPYLGYDQHGDYSKYHSKILLAWLGEDATGTNVAVGSKQLTQGGSGGSFITGGSYLFGGKYFDTEGTAYLTFAVSAEDIIDFSIGKIIIPFQIKTISSGKAIFGVGDADDYIQALMDADGNIDPTYRAASTSETITGNIACAADTWNFLEIFFDDSGNVSSKINGIENGTAQVIANLWGGETSYIFYIGADYAGSNIADLFIGGLIICSDPNTPSNWQALGSGELWIPDAKINGVALRLGTDYEAVRVS
jgi:hypothetical protein